MPVFPVLRSKIQILRRCSKNLRRRASARLQLLEALVCCSGSDCGGSDYGRYGGGSDNGDRYGGVRDFCGSD